MSAFQGKAESGNSSPSLNSRSHIAFNCADDDLAHPEHGISSSQLEGANIQVDITEDFVDQMIKENQDLWDQLMRHPFCVSMGKGTASLDGFRYYMIQDLIYLRDFVRYKLGLFRKATSWKIIKTAPIDLKKDIDYAEDQLKTCVNILGVSLDQVEGTKSAPMVRAYCAWLRMAIEEQDWFSAHPIPRGSKGYDKIATNLDRDDSTDKNTIYYRLWISRNIGGSSVGIYRKFCNENAKRYTSPEAQVNWMELFRTACRMEIAVFDTGLKNPAPYQILQNGIYVIISVFRDNEVLYLEGDAEGAPIIGWPQGKGNKEKWALKFDSNGYTLRNVVSRTYAAVKDNSFQGNSIGDKFWINPSFLDPNTFQVFPVGSQGRVMTTAGPSSVCQETPSQILALPNAFDNGNQVWQFRIVEV